MAGKAVRNCCYRVNRPKEALERIYEVAKAKSIDAPEDSGSGTQGSWETLDSALFEALNISEHGEVERQIELLKKKLREAAGRPVLLDGRQVLHRLDEYMKLGVLDADILEVRKDQEYHNEKQ